MAQNRLRDKNRWLNFPETQTYPYHNGSDLYMLSGMIKPKVLFQPQVLSSIGGGMSPTWLPTEQPNNRGTWHSHKHGSSHSSLNQEQCTQNSKACFYFHQYPSLHSHQHDMKSARRTTIHFPSGLFLTWLLYQSSRSVVLKHVSLDDWSSVQEEGGCGLFVDVNIAVIIWYHFQKYVSYSGILCKKHFMIHWLSMRIYWLRNLDILKGFTHCMCLSGITCVYLRGRAELPFLKMLLFIELILKHFYISSLVHHLYNTQITWK